MKNFKTTRKIDENNINLGIIDGKRIISDDVIQINKLSGNYPNNITPVFRNNIVTKNIVIHNSNFASGINITRLDTNITSDDVLITDQVVYDSNTQSTIPLYYEYALRGYYHNKSRETKTITRQLDDIYIKDILLNDNEILINSDDLTINPENNNNLSKNTYKFDFAGNRIIIINNVTKNLIGNNTIKIDVNTANSDIIVQYLDGTPVNTNHYRIILTSYVNDSTSDFYNLYNCKILFSDIIERENIKIKYLKYEDIETRTINGNKVRNIVDETTEEIVNATAIFSGEINNTLTQTEIIQDIQNDPNKYIINNGNLYSSINDNFSTYYKYNITLNEKITLIEPKNKTIDSCWHVNVKIGEFEHNGYNYSLAEKKTYSLIDNDTINKTSEIPYVIGTNKIALNNNRLYSIKNRDGIEKNIKILIDNIDQSDQIDEVDIKNGLITLKTEISETNKIKVQYSYFSKNIKYNDINFNPSTKFTKNDDILEKYAVIYMLPVEELKERNIKSLFHFFVYKDSINRTGLLDREISISNCINYINGLDDNNRSNLYNNISEYIRDDAGDMLHPIILGYVSVDNNNVQNSLNVTDIRQRGGGIKFELLQDEIIFNEVKSWLDIGNWDGEVLNMNNTIVIEIPKSKINDLILKFNNFDTQTIRDIRNDPNITESRVMEYINKIIKKYTPATKNIHLRFV